MVGLDLLSYFLIHHFCFTRLVGGVAGVVIDMLESPVLYHLPV